MINSPIGHYVYGESELHRLHASSKLIGFITLVIASLFVCESTGLLLIFSAAALVVIISQLKPKIIWASVKPIMPFVALIALFNLFAVQGGETLVALGPFTITAAGRWAAVLYSARLLFAVLLGALYLLTTTPTAITDAFEGILSPLMLFGVPTHEIALIFSLALRFVPILADETQQIIDAQAARGGSIEDGTFKERLQALGAVLVAVFAGAIRHAQNLSLALDARCYEGSVGRTHYHESHFTALDYLFLFFCYAIFSISLIGWAQEVMGFIN